jgi:transposase
MTPPKRIDVTPEELDALLERTRAANIDKKDIELIEGMIQTISYLSNVVDKKSTSIRRLLKMIFGSETEKTKNVIKDENQEPDTSPQNADNTSSEDPKKSDTKKDGKKNKGHGRNGASAYTGASRIQIEHEHLKHKDPCPECKDGKVYILKTPEIIVRVKGSAPLTATVTKLEKLRCNLCGKTFTAKAPDDIGEKKYDETSGAMIALMKYGCGLPFNRLDQLQAWLGVPLPSSTQWDIVNEISEILNPVYQALIYYAAQGDVIYNDDTVMKILELMKEEEPERKGIFTSGIVSIIGKLKISLFFTGRNHAGENLADVLAKREHSLDAPIQMCDALSRNTPKDFITILANCLSHSRRKFVDVVCSFPDECKYVIETLETVYKNDAISKKQKMSPEQRLLYHQTHSGPLMTALKKWIQDQFNSKKVEPNSGLGDAMQYMDKHWDKLTLFLRVPKAPLDNNLCERALKKAILHRKNSMFFKTQRGAQVGDLMMSLIYTCSLNNINPLDYLKNLLKRPDEIKQNPKNWLPWNYMAPLEASSNS